MCAGVGSGGKFRRGPACVGVGSGRRFRKVPVCAGVGSGGNFRKVPEVPACAGVASGGNFCKVPEGSGEFQCFGKCRCGLLPCNLDRSSYVSYVIVFELLVMTLST